MSSLLENTNFFQRFIYACYIVVCLYQLGLNVQCSNAPISTCSIPVACESFANQTSPDVKKECKKRNFTIDSKCCFQNQTLVGLDLTNCELSTLGQGFLSNYSQLVILDLQDNPLKNATLEDFLGLTSLDVLFLPENLSCPGDWKNDTLQSRGHECLGQIDLCNRNVSCDDNGLCVHLGPGLVHCKCQDGFYGYRCLRTGDFPVTTFVVALCVPGLIISAFLWFTQRRHVKMQ